MFNSFIKLYKRKKIYIKGWAPLPPTRRNSRQNCYLLSQVLRGHLSVSIYRALKWAAIYYIALIFKFGRVMIVFFRPRKWGLIFSHADQVRPDHGEPGGPHHVGGGGPLGLPRHTRHHCPPQHNLHHSPTSLPQQQQQQRQLWHHPALAFTAAVKLSWWTIFHAGRSEVGWRVVDAVDAWDARGDAESAAVWPGHLCGGLDLHDGVHRERGQHTHYSKLKIIL